MKYKQSGFTLVEMLTVIAIIGILAALLSTAMVAVRARVQRAGITSEINQLSMALENYKTQYGEYPPDGTDAAAIKRHIARAFPRANADNLAKNVPTDPAQSLVFWLGGPIVNGRPIGFCNNPTDPFNNAVNKSRSLPFFDFPPAQLATTGTNATTATFSSKNGGGPYAYFRANVTGGVGSYSGSYQSADYGKISPYNNSSKNSVWYAETRFQIISPGLDGKYGDGNNDIQKANADALDNQTNFGMISDLLEQ